MQNDLFRSYGWAQKNNIRFNSINFELWKKNNKLKEITCYVTPEQDIISEKQEVKDLGITMTSDNNDKTHTNNIVIQAKRMEGWVLRTFRTQEQTDPSHRRG